jgi:hypothetical protein
MWIPPWKQFSYRKSPHSYFSARAKLTERVFLPHNIDNVLM